MNLFENLQMMKESENSIVTEFKEFLNTKNAQYIANEIGETKEGMQIVIYDGDWKHEHLYMKRLLDEFFTNKGIDISITSEEIGESDQDTFSARYNIFFNAEPKEYKIDVKTEDINNIRYQVTCQLAISNEEIYSEHATLKDAIASARKARQSFMNVKIKDLKDGNSWYNIDDAEQDLNDGLYEGKQYEGAYDINLSEYEYVGLGTGYNIDWLLYCKIVDGKGVWVAKNQKTGEVVPINYDQVQGFEPIKLQGIQKLQKDLGDMLLPKRESTNNSDWEFIEETTTNNEIFGDITESGYYIKHYNDDVTGIIYPPSESEKLYRAKLSNKSDVKLPGQVDIFNVFVELDAAKEFLDDSFVKISPVDYEEIKKQLEEIDTHEYLELIINNSPVSNNTKVTIIGTLINGDEIILYDSGYLKTQKHIDFIKEKYAEAIRDIEHMREIGYLGVKDESLIKIVEVNNDLNISDIDVSSIMPTQKDYDRAEGLQFRGKTFRGSGQPFASEATKMAKLIKDPMKLVRRAKAVYSIWGDAYAPRVNNVGYYNANYQEPGDEDVDVWTPFRQALEQMGFTREQINSIKQTANKSVNESNDVIIEESNEEDYDDNTTTF